MPKLNSVQLKTKELLRFHSGCHGIKISLVLNRNVVSAARDLVPTSKKPLPFTNCYQDCRNKEFMFTVKEVWDRVCSPENQFFSIGSCEWPYTSSLKSFTWF